MVITAAELALLFILLAGLFYYLGIFAKISTVLAFLGAVTLGASGHVGAILGDVFGWISSVFGVITAWAVGVTFTGALLIIGLIIVAHDLHPKNGAGKRTRILGFLVGLGVAAGVAALPFLASISGLVATLMTGIASALSSL